MSMVVGMHSRLVAILVKRVGKEEAASDDGDICNEAMHRNTEQQYPWHQRIT
jgi:hypothetical protein